MLLAAWLVMPCGVAMAQCKVTAGGELRTRILRNFDRLEEEKYRPDKVFLTEKQSGFWPADTEGRTILGLVLDAQASGRQPLYLSEIMRRLPAHLNAKGYMGSIHEGQADEQQLSGHGWLLRALSEYYLWKHDPATLSLIRTVTDSLFLPVEPYIASYPLDPTERSNDKGGASGSIAASKGHWRLSTDIGCIFIAMDGFLQAVQILDANDVGGKEDRHRMADAMIALFLKFPMNEIKAQTHASLTGMRALLRYSGMTGRSDYIGRVEKMWRTYKRYGMTETYANYNWFRRYDTWTEPCAIVDSYMVVSQLWQLTHNLAYLVDAERIYWNAICRAQRDNGGFGLENCPGLASGSDCISLNAYEAHWCCTMRGGEGLSRAAEYSAFAVGDTLWLTTFRDMAVSAGLHAGVLEADVQTNYPFASDVSADVRIKSAPRGECVLALPVFPWASRFKASINGRRVKAASVSGMMVMRRKFNDGDVVHVTFSMQPEYLDVVNPDNNAAGAFRVAEGPMLLAADSCGGNLVRGERLKYDGRGCYVGAKSGTRLSGLYHLMDAKVNRKEYARRVVFGR